jgi:hypothetical protein
VPLIISFISPWNFNKFSDIVMMTGGDLPAAFGTEIYSRWTPFSPVETILSSFIWRSHFTPREGGALSCLDTVVKRKIPSPCRDSNTRSFSP